MARERHPVPAPPTGLPLDQRVLLLENRLAQLWDEVWWHQLPWYRRLGYRLQGFRSPLRRFYVPYSDPTPDLDLKL
jgi:hypothetical protein